MEVITEVTMEVMGLVSFHDEMRVDQTTLSQLWYFWQEISNSLIGGNGNNGLRGSPNSVNGAIPSNYGENNVGATRHDPWRDFLDRLREWGSGIWGGRQVKRAVGRNVYPNRATIGEHSFNLELMSTELRSEIYTAIFNHTQYEDLQKSLFEYEIQEK
jgi:hypothetical protein